MNVITSNLTNSKFYKYLIMGFECERDNKSFAENLSHNLRNCRIIYEQ